MALHESINQDPVTDLSVRELLVIKPTDSVRHACHVMREANLGAAITLDEAGKPVGMFNEKILIRLLAEDADAMDTPVGNHLTTYVATVKQTDTVAHLIHTMQSKDFRWVCVVDGAGRAVALTGLRGAMEYIVDHFPREVKVQSLGSKLSIDEREGA